MFGSECEQSTAGAGRGPPTNWRTFQRSSGVAGGGAISWHIEAPVDPGGKVTPRIIGATFRVGIVKARPGRAGWDAPSYWPPSCLTRTLSLGLPCFWGFDAGGHLGGSDFRLAPNFDVHWATWIMFMGGEADLGS